MQNLKKVDIAVAPYIMTSEREEFIDFVSPYYEQSGLIISKLSSTFFFFKKKLPSSCFDNKNTI